MNALSLFILTISLTDMHYTVLRPTIDVTPPTVEGEDYFSFSYYNNYDEDWLLGQWTITDNQSSYAELDIYFNDRLDFTTVGKRDYILYVTDKNNNETSFPFTLDVIDDIAPVIEGPSFLEYDIYNAPSIDEILSFYSVFDEIDKDNCLWEVSRDEYSSSLHEAGIYYITFEASDHSLNYSSFDVMVQVDEVESTIWYIDNIDIPCYSDHYMTLKEIQLYLVNNMYIEDIPYSSIICLEGEYDEYYSVQGIYPVKVELIPEDSSYSSIEVTINMNVSVRYENESEEKEESISFFRFLVLIFEKLCEMVLYAWNLLTSWW